MPSELAPHERTYLIWPERPDNWRSDAGPAQEAFTEVASVVSAYEPVTVLASAKQWERARSMLPSRVAVAEMTTDDAWARDTGPTVLLHPGTGARRGVDWPFNAWGGEQGGLYPSWHFDDQVAAKVCELEGLDRHRAPLVLEGGAVHVDGEGTCLTTEECLLNPNRGPGRDRRRMERLLGDYLGVERVIWLPEGVVADETDGHVDNLACFTRPGRVLLTWCEDPDDPMARVCRRARDVLEGSTDARGRSLEVAVLPSPGPLTMTAAEAAGVRAMPGTKPRTEGARLAASYVNFYVANGAVVYPLLDRRFDGQVAEMLAAELPGRRVIGVAAREILLGGGNIHCITQQVPRPPSEGSRGGRGAGSALLVEHEVAHGEGAEDLQQPDDDEPDPDQHGQGHQ